MDKDRSGRRPKPTPATNMDGFIVNRRGRNLNEPFSRKVHSNNSLSGRDKQITTSPKKFAPNTQAAAVTWTPRIQDPAAIQLSRKTRRKPIDPNEKKKKGWKRIAKKGGLTLLVIILIIGGFVGFKFFHTIDKVFGGNVFSNIGSLFSSTTLKGENNGRINILLAGDLADQIGHGGADLTDSILLLSINTKNHSAFLLSIPRDLWVSVPGQSGYAKINAANDDTSFSQSGYPNGGMGALESVVQQDLGIPIDYYGLMDYGAFRDSVNAVGGVRVDIQSPDPRGLYDPNAQLNLPNGWVSLNGQQALDLARARGDGYGSYGFPDSDFDRTQHQRQIFIAVAQKAKSLGVVSNPVKISDLFNALGNNFQTDLSLADVLKLVQLTKGINLNTVQSYAYCSTITIGQNGCTTAILTGYTDPSSGQEALVPVAGIGNYNAMQFYYQKLTSNNPIVKEGASVVVLNGGNTQGLAKAYQQSLTTKGIDVTTIADTVALYPQTEIMDNSSSKDPTTKAALESTFGSNVIANDPRINTTNATFVVILGASQGQPSSNN